MHIHSLRRLVSTAAYRREMARRMQCGPEGCSVGLVAGAAEMRRVPASNASSPSWRAGGTFRSAHRHMAMAATTPSGPISAISCSVTPAPMKTGRRDADSGQRPHRAASPSTSGLPVQQPATGASRRCAGSAHIPGRHRSSNEM